MTEYAHPDRDLPTTVKSQLLITTVRVEENFGHDLVHVWNRGGKSGVLTVNRGDGVLIARLLLRTRGTPEMLAALQAAERSLEATPDLAHHNAVRRQVRAAIEKAAGAPGRRDDPDPDVRHGGKHHGDPWCDPAAR